jgi:hypothetical protein
MPLVSKPASLACRAERLAWAASGPHGPVIRPTGEPESIAPSPDAGEEVTLSASHKLTWYDILDRSLIDISWCYQPLFY